MSNFVSVWDNLHQLTTFINGGVFDIPLYYRCKDLSNNYLEMASRLGQSSQMEFAGSAELRELVISQKQGQFGQGHLSSV